MNDLINFNKKLLYSSPKINGNKIIFADNTATGRPCKLIEKKIEKNILPYYSNTHSNAFCGIFMKNLIKETRNFIRKEWNLNNEHKIIFTGSGATSATNLIVNSIDYENYNTVNIYITNYEHYSNHLPWIEKTKIYKNTNLHIFEKATDIKLINDPNILNIISVIHYSNVDGCLFQDFEKLIELRKSFSNTFLLSDYACSAPYVKIDLKDIDGIYVSMHKFLGGVSCPGILIAHEKLFQKKTPNICGGNCVKTCDKNKIIYSEDIEKRESAGTQNVCGIIKILYILQLKNELMPLIINNNKIITKYVYDYFEKLSKKYKVIVINKCNKNYNNRLPIISFAINNVHYNYITVLLNDLFGIQTRSGIFCSKLYFDIINKKYNIDGYTRITFSYSMDKDIINYILKSVKFIIINYKKYEHLYFYNKEENIFHKI